MNSCALLSLVWLFAFVFHLASCRADGTPVKAQRKEKKKYRAVVLVLSSAGGNPIYDALRNVWLQFMRKEPLIKVLMVYGTSGAHLRNPSLVIGDNDNNSSNNTDGCDLVFSTVQDTYPVTIEKVLYAMKYIDGHYEYDYLVRTNLSTFWIWSRLLQHLDSLTAGAPVYEGDGPLPYNLPASKRFYVSGVDTIVTRDMVRRLASSAETMQYVLRVTAGMAEDAAMGVFFHNVLKVPLSNSSRSMLFAEDFSSPRDFVKMQGLINAADKDVMISHFRVKSRGQHRLEIDTFIMHSLLRHYY